MKYSTFIHDTIENRTKIEWNYYETYIAAKNVISPAESRKFIRQYFEAGAKELPLALDPMEANEFFRCSCHCGKKCDLFQIPPITINLDRKAGQPVRLSLHLVPKLQ